MKSLYRLAILMVFWLGCTGCGKSGSDSLGLGLSNCTSNPQNTLANFLGTWTSGCYAYASTWQKDTLVVAGNAITETAGAYSESTCTNAIQTTVTTATVTVGPTSAGIGAGAWNNLDFAITDIQLRPGTAAQATSFNSTVYVNGTCGGGSTTGFCGVTTWASGVANSILGKNDCNSNCIFPAGGGVLKQNFGLGRVSGGSLFCGNPVNGVAFGYTSRFDAKMGVIPGGSPSSYPTSAWGGSNNFTGIFTGP